MTSIYQDVTNQVDFQLNDDELLPMTRCACGAKFAPWNFSIGIEKDYPNECPVCGRRFYFSVQIHVYEVIDDTQKEG